MTNCTAWKKVGRGYGHWFGVPCQRASGHRWLHRGTRAGKTMRWFRMQPRNLAIPPREGALRGSDGADAARWTPQLLD